MRPEVPLDTNLEGIRRRATLDGPDATSSDGRERPRVYLAGPDVFLRDAVAQGERKTAVCARYGLTGVFPFDAEARVDPYASGQDAGYRISEANETLIRGCVAVIANMTPFRGISADVGTAYEMGFGRALGLVVFAYTNVLAPLVERAHRVLGPGTGRDASGGLRDAQDMAVEEFDLTDNLMLEGGIRASGGTLVRVSAPEAQLFTYLGGFEECVRLAREVLL